MGQISSSVEIQDKLNTFWEEKFEVAVATEKKSKKNFIVLYNGKPGDYSLFRLGVKGKARNLPCLDTFFALLVNSKDSIRKAIDDNYVSFNIISKLGEAYRNITENVTYNSKQRELALNKNNRKIIVTTCKCVDSGQPPIAVEMSMLWDTNMKEVGKNHILVDLLCVLFIHKKVIGKIFEHAAIKAGFSPFPSPAPEHAIVGDEHKEANLPNEDHKKDDSNNVTPLADVKQKETGNGKALRQTEFEIDSLQHQLREKEDEIATLSERLSETNQRLVAEMGDKKSCNESSLEDKSHHSRKMNFETIYQLLLNKEWTEAMEFLDKNIPQESSYQFICDVLWESWRCCNEYHSSHVKPEVRKICKFIRFGIDVKSIDVSHETQVNISKKNIDVSLENKVDNFIAKCMREHVERLNVGHIEEKINALMEKQNKTFMKSEIVQACIRKSVSLCWQMALQRPPAILEKPIYEEGRMRFGGIQKQEAHHTHAENRVALGRTNSEIDSLRSHRVALGRTNSEIDSLRQQLREKEAEIAKLCERLSETTQRLAGEMNAKIACDESRFENISIRSRPLNLANEYHLLQTNEWLEAKESLDNNDMLQKKSCMYLCDVLWESWRCCNEYHENHVKPEVRKTAKFIRFAIDNKSIDASLEKEVEIFLGDRMREYILSFNETKIVEKVKSIMMEKQSKRFLKSQQVQEYIRKCVILCWQMILQRPQMMFQKPIGRTYEAESARFNLSFGSKPGAEAKICYCLYPCLLHGENVMAKGSIYVE